jgi:hypothetical protein
MKFMRSFEIRKTAGCRFTVALRYLRPISWIRRHFTLGGMRRRLASCDSNPKAWDYNGLGAQHGDTHIRHKESS